ncbi:MAG: hypothetical protein DI536_15890 [Archangium gephyra]|uniref:Amine oxidase n=1 Tax=Archangium gephyra TaxID=48 RepID=A0A2W5URT1_9BACT|nr:MAG: hypothetical protein DI536_15890 [Archangium gephyra]
MYEYLLVDLVMIAPLVLVGLFRPQWFQGGLKPGIKATISASIPFIVWDALVVNRHWWFNPAYVMPLRIFGLPVEEYLFFCIVPLACIFTWELAFAAKRERPVKWLSFAPWLVMAVTAALGAWAWSTGREYTAFSLWSVGFSALMDVFAGTRVYSMVKGWAYLVTVGALTTVFNGYLTGRPIVQYDERFQLPFRVITIPIEDYGFGIALAMLAASLYQANRARRFAPSLFTWLIEKRFGGYRHEVEVPNPSAPEKLAAPERVAVIGGGLAGLTAAELLSRRGFEVTVFEKNTYLGGKLSSWKEDVDGKSRDIEHGFHAFFHHYYNFNHWLAETGLSKALEPVGDYLVIGADGRRYSFQEVENTPLLNLIALYGKGLFRMVDVANPTTGQALQKFLEWDDQKIPAQLDEVSFAEYAKKARIPKSLMVIFTAFARAFFAHEDRLSMSELVKSFHFYYLSHDRGLSFDRLTSTVEEAVMGPLATRLRAQGVTIRTGAAVKSLKVEGGFEVDGERFDSVVLAANVTAAKALLPGRFDALTAGQRYAVLRLWLSKPLGGEKMPAFVATERVRALDAFCPVSDEVLELHSYALPDDLSDADVTRVLEEEFKRYVPHFDASSITSRHLQLRDDFTAFHLGLAKHRPSVETNVPGLVLAGDWVGLPFPSMLMEGAHTSGVMAANVLCKRAGVRTFPVWSVPKRGLLARG